MKTCGLKTAISCKQHAYFDGGAALIKLGSKDLSVERASVWNPCRCLCCRASKQVLLLCTAQPACGAGTSECFCQIPWASFANDIQFSPSLDDFAGVTQFLNGRAHTHRVVNAFERVVHSANI